MKWTVVIAAVVAALSSFSTAPVYASDVADVVRARANARAGGGTSGHDAWVLKRHGKLSGSSRSTRRALAKKKAAKKRALLAAKARKLAAAKRRAMIAAKKKKAAQRRAYLLAKKKKQAAMQAKLAARAAHKKKKAKLAARAAKAKFAAEQKAKAQKLAAVEQQTTEAESLVTEKKDSAYVATPSTATLMTRRDLSADTVDAKANPSPTTDIASADTATAPVVVEQADSKVPSVGAQDKALEASCKRFLPAIGLTISVGC